MNQLLEQFIHESRDFLQQISENLLQLENDPENSEIITELFRAVHTLKGNSGLFDFPIMTKILHSAEDLMTSVRDKRIPFSSEIADMIFEVMDFVSILFDEIEHSGELSQLREEESENLIKSFEDVNSSESSNGERETSNSTEKTNIHNLEEFKESLLEVPENVLMACFEKSLAGDSLHIIKYVPEESSFYKGEDPFFFARNIPGLLWGLAISREQWPPLDEIDCYRCMIDFFMISDAPANELLDCFRYVSEQVSIVEAVPETFIIPSGEKSEGEIYSDFIQDGNDFLEKEDLVSLKKSAEILLELSSADLWASSAFRWIKFLIETDPEKKSILKQLINSLEVQSLATVEDVDVSSLSTVRTADVQSPATVKIEGGQSRTTGKTADVQSQPTTKTADVQFQPSVKAAEVNKGYQDKIPENETVSAAKADIAETLLKTQLEVLQYNSEDKILKGKIESCGNVIISCLEYVKKDASSFNAYLSQALEGNSVDPVIQWLNEYLGIAEKKIKVKKSSTPGSISPKTEEAYSFREKKQQEESTAVKILKVDQVKIDRLMGLIGEMVVSKNALPFLAERAEKVFKTAELARDLKAQFNVINRIVEEMQDSIMQIRMIPFSTVFQRFPRLVRDISRRLDKQVALRIEGEDTEAEKNIVESISDSLIHIIRNSLDHGIESPQIRREAGKPEIGTIQLKAYQKADRVIVEIKDDGKGIDAESVKRKAYEKGLIDEEMLERITSADDAINLIFLSGFSTAENVSDISGRGVGMDVVKTAVEKIGGDVTIKSSPGEGTEILLSLPLSMAVTNVMVFESHKQIFGIQMDQIVETVKVPDESIKIIKHQRTAVLRDRLIPLFDLTELLSIDSHSEPNDENEYAVVVVRNGGEYAGLVVDDFREVVDIILKPMPGELCKLPYYAGTALLGDGSILIVVNPRELF